MPWEILRAAGVTPLVLRPSRPPSQWCEQFLEPGAFSPRIRGLFESALAGDWSLLSAVVFARTSEQDYKAYLYVREVVREGHAGIPPLWFYDLLYSPSPQAREYGRARTRDLAVQLEAFTGRPIHVADLEAAVAESNLARAAVRRLLALRRGRPKLTGTEALSLVGSFFLLDRTTYAALATRAAEEIEPRAPLAGARLALAGAWVDDGHLHALVESHGAVIVAEEGGWGSRSAGQDVATDADPLTAIADRYHRDGPSVRQFPMAHRAWLDHLDGADVDGVVFYVPPHDRVAGWDVPLDRHRLQARGVPSLVIRDDVEDPAMPARWHEPIAAFVRQAGRER